MCWRVVERLVDSGAVGNVGDPNPFPEYSLRASEGSKNNLHHLAANNGKIKNQAEQPLSSKAEDGVSFKLVMQSAAVSRPILSIIRLAENGKEVAFRKDGGTIRDVKTGRTMEFERKHGVYVLRIWVRIGAQIGDVTDAGFARRA